MRDHGTGVFCVSLELQPLMVTCGLNSCSAAQLMCGLWCRSVSAPRTLGDVESTGMARLVGLTRAKGPRGALNPIKQQALTVRSNINHNTREEGRQWDSGGGGVQGQWGRAVEWVQSQGHGDRAVGWLQR